MTLRRVVTLFGLITTISGIGKVFVHKGSEASRSTVRRSRSRRLRILNCVIIYTATNYNATLWNFCPLIGLLKKIGGVDRIWWDKVPLRTLWRQFVDARIVTLKLNLILFFEIENVEKLHNMLKTKTIYTKQLFYKKNKTRCWHLYPSTGIFGLSLGECPSQG